MVGFSHNTTQLAATALVSGAVVATTILGYQQVQRERRAEQLKHSIPELDHAHAVQRLNEYGAVEASPHLNKEDERSAALAARAMAGDYDGGGLSSSDCAADGS